MAVAATFPGAPRSLDPGPVELLLDGLALLITDGRAAAAPTLRQAASAFAGADVSAGGGLRWGWLATTAACLLWDDDGLRAILARQVQPVRDAGALEGLPIYLESSGIAMAWSGDFGAAASLIAEVNAVCEATGSRIASFAALLLACLRGSQAEAVSLIDATLNEGEAGGQGLAVTCARWAAAVLYNGLPLRRGTGGSPAGRRGPIRAPRLPLGAARADRGRRTQRE